MGIFSYIRQTFADAVFVMKYLTLGIISTVLNFGGFWFLYEVIEVWYLAAAAGAFLLRYGVKFLLVRSWLFGVPAAGSVRGQVVRFTLLEGLYLGAGLALLAFLVEVLDFPPFWGLVVSSFVTSMSALVITRFVFGPAKAPGAVPG